MARGVQDILGIRQGAESRASSDVMFRFDAIDIDIHVLRFKNVRSKKNCPFVVKHYTSLSGKELTIQAKGTKV
jgi:hypothetical protein